MPKRAMTPQRRREIALWQQASAKTRAGRRSWSNPVPAGSVLKGKYFPKSSGQFGLTRSHKLGGKSYQHKSGTGFAVAPEATAILNGKANFRNPAQAHAQMVAALSPSKNPTTGKWFGGIGSYKKVKH